MRILYQGFVGKNHSWSIVAQNLCRALIQLGHQVEIFSTNGTEHFPVDLKPNLIGHNLLHPTIPNKGVVVGKRPEGTYDMQLSYTALKNFSRYLSHGPKNRFGIYCYEFAGPNALPIGFAKQHTYCDRLLAPSTFAKQVFLDSGIPEAKISVIPHGINANEIEAATPYKLKTTKATKILINLGQIHRRKDLPLALEIFGRSFQKQDDVCLVLKVQEKAITQQFELSFDQLFREFKTKFPNHAEIEVIKEFIPNIYSLYKSCQIMFSTTNTEGFGMPQLESLSMGLINVCSRYGGVLDFLNDDNSLLINGTQFKVPGNYLYYQNKPGTLAFKCNLEDGVKQLTTAVSNLQTLQTKLLSTLPKFQAEYHWTRIGERILQLVQ